MRAPSRDHGMTLIELMIAMTVSLVVVAGALVAGRTQQKAYVDGQRLRTAQASARRALLAVERMVPNAGWGLDAPLAFDFSGWTGRPCPSTMGTCPVDSTSGPDELVFLFRDPWYWVSGDAANPPVGNAWILRNVDATSFTVDARAGDVFRKGQIFSAVCFGSSSYTYFTADTTTTATAAGPLRVTLKSAVTANPFLRQDVAVLPVGKTENCFNPSASGLASTPPRLFMVNRYRIHIHPASLGTFGTATRYDPLLVLDRGVDMNGDGNVDEYDEELLAEGIESMQVSYGFFSSAVPVAGETAAITFSARAPLSIVTTANEISTTLFPGTPGAADTSPYQASSFYGFGVNGAPSDGSAWARSGNNQANIQLVRVAFLARSLEPDLASFTSAAQQLPLFNQTTSPTWVNAPATALGGHDGYQRMVFQTSVVLQNMTFRAMPYF